jgi:UDP-N-acetylglucosamine--N-acetylmuramyl-(pentapeptide) pyrophosphoryl-undecaprenol N-acetylglucosamine transferase
VPVLIYLPDVTPGEAIRWTSRLAERVAVSFPEVTHYFGHKAVVTGYPVRSELLAADRQAARVALGLPADLPVLLVMGGSRGARSINRALEGALPALLPHCQVVHVSGELDWPVVSKIAGKLPKQFADRYRAYPYLHEMPLAFAAANLVIARAGAATLGEFPAVGLPSILAPYPYSGQHQDANAAYLADRGAALVLQDGELGSRLAATVLGLLDAPERMTQMAHAAAALARPDAAANIAQELRKLAATYHSRQV